MEAQHEAASADLEKLRAEHGRWAGTCARMQRPPCSAARNGGVAEPCQARGYTPSLPLEAAGHLLVVAPRGFPASTQRLNAPAVPLPMCSLSHLNALLESLLHVRDSTVGVLEKAKVIGWSRAGCVGMHVRCQCPHIGCLSLWGPLGAPWQPALGGAAELPSQAGAAPG